MDLYSSGEDLVIKTRKPYTITKQRERWTEEEHNRFLEALKLYGRAWQRIEEHIGTKTAVQIRSHAQKFFTKLEKEANVKGVPIGHALDIEIPPPRPKRKPSNPYPRKTSVGTSTSQVGVKDEKISTGISSSCQSAMTSEKEPEKPCDDGKLGCNGECPEKDNCSKAFTLLKTAPYATQSSAHIISSISEVSRTFRQFVPLSNEANNPDETAASQVTIEARGSQTEQSYNKQPFQDNPPFKISNVVNSYLPQEKSVHNKSTDELKQPDVTNTSQTAEAQASQNYPRHVPVHILDGSLGLNASNISTDMSFTDSMIHQMGGGVHSHQNLSTTPEHSKSSTHQSFPSYHPVFTPVQNQDDYHSFVHMSTAFSSLIISALSQNPASYAAASFAATMWPSMNMEAPGEASTQSRPVTTAPSMAAIAAATVAAATAWWAAHGLLPLCAPYHPTFTCSPSATPMESSQDRTLKGERRANSPDRGQQLEPGYSEAVNEQNSASKSPTLSSSDSEGAKMNVGLAASETAKVEDAAEMENPNKHMSKKPVDRSSCGSNTPSSSEVEGDALEKHADGIEETVMNDNEVPEEVDAAHPVGDFSRRCRSIANINDSWKEVSEGGRIAFQALFSRERLPQSFSPPHKGKKNCNKEEDVVRNEKGLELDLNGKAWEGTCSQKQGEEENAPLMGENKEEGLHNIGLGQGKLKARRTGFKPYKRCSMEAKECRVSANGQDEEKCPKRIRLEGEAST